MICTARELDKMGQAIGVGYRRGCGIDNGGKEPLVRPRCRGNMTLPRILNNYMRRCREDECDSG